MQTEDKYTILKEFRIFDVISGFLIGKPQDETYYNEYKAILLEEIFNDNLYIVYNVNIGHLTPRYIIPFVVDVTKVIMQVELDKFQFDVLRKKQKAKINKN